MNTFKSFKSYITTEAEVGHKISQNLRKSQLDLHFRYCKNDDLLGSS